MTGIAIKDGKALIVDGKAVLGDCYCDCYSYDYCPNCCITIEWGTFNEDGDLEEQFIDLIVTLVMPTKDSRIVCDEEMVTVRITFTLDGGTVSTDHAPYIRWDRAWLYAGRDPEVDPDCGRVFFDGLIEWCELTPDGIGGFYDTYEVTLAFDKCWADSSVQFGDIEAGDRNGSFALITGTSCTSTECCEPVIDCGPCCFFIDPTNDPDGYELNDSNEPVFWAENAQGDRIRVTVKGMDPDTLTVCIGPDGDSSIQLEIALIPVEYSPADPWIPEVGVSASGWLGTSHSPGVGTGSFDYGPPVEIYWGDDIEDLDYTVDMEVPCPEIPGEISVGFSNGSDGEVDGASIVIFWTCCPEDENDCEQCYPAPETENYAICFGDTGPYAGDPADPPLPDCGEFYYKGRVRDTLGSYETPAKDDGHYYYGFLWIVRACFFPPDIEAQKAAYELALSGLIPFHYNWNAAATVAGEKSVCLETPINGPYDPEAPMNAPDLVEDVLGDDATTSPPCPECEDDC